MTQATRVRARRRKRYDYSTEYKQLVFDATKEIPDLTEYFVSDWRIEGQIVVGSIVILHLSRDIETEVMDNE